MGEFATKLVLTGVSASVAESVTFPVDATKVSLGPDAPLEYVRYHKRVRKRGEREVCVCGCEVCV
jgi:hypothetical protein